LLAYVTSLQIRKAGTAASHEKISGKKGSIYLCYFTDKNLRSKGRFPCKLFQTKKAVPFSTLLMETAFGFPPGSSGAP